MGDPGGSVLYMVGAFLALYFAGVLVWLAVRGIGRLCRRDNFGLGDKHFEHGVVWYFRDRLHVREQLVESLRADVGHAYTSETATASSHS